MLLDQRSESIPTSVLGVAGKERVSYTNRVLGTRMVATAQTAEAERVLLDLSVEQTGTFQSASDLVLGADEKGQPLRAASLFSERLQTQFLVAPNRAYPLAGPSVPLRRQMLTIIHARWVE